MSTPMQKLNLVGFTLLVAAAIFGWAYEPMVGGPVLIASALFYIAGALTNIADAMRLGSGTVSPDLYGSSCTDKPNS